MNRHAYALAGLTLVVLTAALVSPGHALMLALGLAGGPWLARFIDRRNESVAIPDAAVRREPRTIGLGPVLDAVSLPLVVLDGRARVYHANPPARIAFPALDVGAPLSFALRNPYVLDAVNAALADGALRSAELVERIPVERVFSCVVAPLTDARAGTGQPAAVLMLRDASKERAIETMHVDFVANASHELRTPLASILGFIETLQGAAKNDAAAREKFLAIMDKQARRMARLVDDLLSLSRIELKAHIPPTDAVDLGAIIDANALALSGVAHERGVELSVEKHAQSQVVVGDHDQLASLVENLIENAIKYGKTGKRVEIVLSDAVNPQELNLVIRDFGPGIAPEHLPRISERFYRIDSAVSRSEGGTGLGLALVKHTVNRHRGRLTIESALGRGTTVTVALPRFTDGARVPVINP